MDEPHDRFLASVRGAKEVAVKNAAGLIVQSYNISHDCLAWYFGDITLLPLVDKDGRMFKDDPWHPSLGRREIPIGDLWGHLSGFYWPRRRNGGFLPAEVWNGEAAS